MTHNSSHLNPFHNWIMSHLRALLFALGELIHTPIASLITICVIGIAMALPTWLYIFLQNFQKVDQHWDSNPHISLYLKQNTAEDNIKALMQELRRNAAIKELKYISPDEGLKEFSQFSELGNTLNKLQYNPLPPVVVITPKSSQTPQELQTLMTQLRQYPEVDVSQLDLTWVKRLYSIITLSQRLTYSLAFLFGIGVILIVGNTIRLATQNRQQEIQVLKLVGATHAFIRRPLLYRGVLYGFLGGALAWILVTLILWWLNDPATELMQSYHQGFLLHGLDFKTGFSVVICCAVLGWLGSWLVMQRHLMMRDEV